MIAPLEASIVSRYARSRRVASAIDGAPVDTDATLPSPDMRVSWAHPAELVEKRSVRLSLQSDRRRPNSPNIWDAIIRVDSFAESKTTASSMQNAARQEVNKRGRPFVALDPAVGCVLFCKFTGDDVETFNDLTGLWNAGGSLELTYQTQEE